MTILAINPGGGSTKVAIFRGRRCLLDVNVRHHPDELSRCPTVLDQYDLRRRAVVEFLEQHGYRVVTDRDRDTDRSHYPPPFDAVVSRGGTLKPMPGGIYRITDAVVADIRAGRVQTMHPSLLGPLLAHDLAENWQVPAYFVDPESTDEFWPRARYSGIPEIERRALSHALSVRSVARRAAQKLGKPLNRCSFVVAHLGTGITVAALLRGRQVDASNANEDGPMAPQRSGGLPAEGLVDFCFAGLLAPDKPVQRQADASANWADAVAEQRRRVLKRIQRAGGLLAYLGTDDIREVERRIDRHDTQAAQVFDAMVYQVAKEIGAYSVVLKGNIDAIVLTGGLTHSARLVRQLRIWIRHLAPRILVYPGEEEMQALAEAVIRVKNRVEKEKKYG